MIRLIKPVIEYWQDYLEAMRECQMAGDISKQMNLSAQSTYTQLEKNATAALRAYKALEEGRGLPEGIVPCNHFWLLNGNHLVGVGAARHYLTNDLEMNGGHIDYLVRPSLRGRGWEAKLLSLIIKECGKRGIKNVLITHPDSNRTAAEAADRNGCHIFDQVTLTTGAVQQNIVRRLADTKIHIQTWRDPKFEFKNAAHILGNEVELELSSTVLGDRFYCPAYHFNILKSGTLFKVGKIDLRIGYDPEIYCSGNIGYSIEDRQRGHGYAAKAASLLTSLARAHGMHVITITCNPDNIASAKTAENLNAQYLELIKLPKSSGQYKQGDRFKRRYIWEL